MPLRKIMLLLRRPEYHLHPLKMIFGWRTVWRIFYRGILLVFFDAFKIRKNQSLWISAPKADYPLRTLEIYIELEKKYWRMPPFFSMVQDMGWYWWLFHSWAKVLYPIFMTWWAKFVAVFWLDLWALFFQPTWLVLFGAEFSSHTPPPPLLYLGQEEIP